MEVLLIQHHFLKGRGYCLWCTGFITFVAVNEDDSGMASSSRGRGTDVRVRGRGGRKIDSALVLYRRGKGRHGRGRGRGKGRSYEISTSESASLGDSQKVCHGLTSFFSKSPCILANSSCNFTPSILLSSFSNLTTGFLCIRNSLVIFSPRTSASSC